jgi:plasmid stabilization system protein ParE
LGESATARLLAEYPGIGRQTDVPDVRVLPVARYPYLVYYTLVGNELVVVHVRHGARAAPSPANLE